MTNYNKNDSLFMKAAQGLPTHRPPIWMMRQAGRYMHEYQAIRKNHSFLDMIKTPKLAAEITLQPIEAFGFDAAILFSDILTVCEAMGCPYELIEKKGPIFSKTISTPDDISNIQPVAVRQSMGYVFDAISEILPKLEPYNIPLLGFSGAPFTLASYMIEGQSSSNLLNCKSFYYHNPKAFHELLTKISDVVVDYLTEQIKTGVSAVQIFDTWACHLNNEEFESLSLAYIKRIIEKLKPLKVPIIVFCKGSGHTYNAICSTRPSVISIDSSVKLASIIDAIPKHVGIQGNLDPLFLFGPKEKIKKEVTEILDITSHRPGFIFNLGHGILPKTPREHVKLVVDLVQNYKPKS